MAKTIKEKALLVNLKCRMWSATKSDSEAGKMLQGLTGASDGIGKVTKSLINRQALSKINSIKSQATKYHESVTMPWFDNGYRILPAKSFMKYTETLRTHKAEFEAAIETITDEYSSYIQQARKDLGTMFKIHEYPMISDIEKMFSFDTGFMPLPDFADFRIELNDAELAGLQKEMKAQMQAAEKAATDDLFKRLHEVIDKMVTRLSNPDSKFHDSLFNNLEEVLSILPDMNITDNKKLTETIKTAKTLLKNPDSVRQDDKLRKVVATEAQTLLETIEGYSDCF